ncbi:MAG: hypothetical protein OHK0011_03370 [Turneriella sp.]
MHRGRAGELPDSASVSACSVHFTPLVGELTIASAGHPRLIIYRARTAVTRYKPRGMPLEVKESSPEYSLEYAAVEPGDIVLLYTEGMVEQGVISREEFGLDRIEGVIGRRRTQGFDDDIAFVVMKITEEATRRRA